MEHASSGIIVFWSVTRETFSIRCIIDISCLVSQSIRTRLLYLDDMTVSFVEYHANVTDVAAIVNKE